MDKQGLDFILTGLKDDVSYIRQKVDNLDTKYASKDLLHTYARWFGGLVAAVVTTFWSILEHLKH